MDRTLAQLTAECISRKISIPSTGHSRGNKVGRQDLIDLLAKQSYDNLANPSWGLTERMKIVSPMLCFGFKHLKPNEQKVAMESDSWIGEQKYDGARMMVFYHPNEGFTFISRNISVTDFLPVDYTNQVLLIKDGVVAKAGDFKGKWKHSFILDTEIVCDNKNIDTTLFSKNGVVTGSELNAVSAILAINQNDSHEIQMKQANLRFVAFDLLNFDDRAFWKEPLKVRKVALKQLTEALGKVIPITESQYVTGDKNQFYKDMLDKGYEGIVLKNLNAAYVPTSSRRRDAQVKRKRSVAESLGGDIDGFITGYVPATEDKGWGKLIGAIEVSVILHMSNGEEKEHLIASISSLPMELRIKMTVIGADGKPTLNPEYLDKVVTINGQDVSSRNLRFMHATCDWNIGFRTDKTKYDCVLMEEFLKAQVL